MCLYAQVFKNYGSSLVVNGLHSSFFTSDRIIPDLCGFPSFEVSNTQTVVAHLGCSFRKTA